jgi:hypothetical protein
LRSKAFPEGVRAGGAGLSPGQLPLLPLLV